MKLLFDCHCQNVHLFRYNGSRQFYNQTTFFPTKQTVSPLLLFHVNEAGERNTIPATRRGERELAIEL